MKHLQKIPLVISILLFTCVGFASQVPLASTSVGAVIIDSDSPLIEAGDDDMAETDDHALSCEHDSDYSCEKWARSAAVTELRDYLRSTTIRIDITQAYINDLNRSNQIMAAVLTAVPVAAVGRLILALSETLYMSIAADTASAVAGVLVGLAVETELKAGDVLLFVDGGETIIHIPVEGEEARWGFDDSNPTPDEPNAGTNNSSAPPAVFWGSTTSNTRIAVGGGGTVGGFRCQIGYTGTKGKRMLKQWICT